MFALWRQGIPTVLTCALAIVVVAGKAATFQSERLISNRTKDVEQVALELPLGTCSMLSLNNSSWDILLTTLPLKYPRLFLARHLLLVQQRQRWSKV